MKFDPINYPISQMIHQSTPKLCPGKSTKARDNHNEDRYVTTAPSYDAKLRPNDKVFNKLF